MQSNILGYNPRWRDVFDDVLNGSISTSWDPEETCRTVNGRAEVYARVYELKLKAILEDGWRPKVISTFSEDTAPLMHEVYDRALASSKSGHVYDIRLNYRYPAGRAAEAGPSILPSTYGQHLVEIYDRWISDAPDFLVTPFDQMMMKVVGLESGRCPWTKGCTGRIIEVEPNMDVFNCGEFADLDDDHWCFGNLLSDGIDACLSSAAARRLAARRLRHPDSCKSCIHFAECEGGCMRDSVLFDEGLYGKFYYCESWQEVFSRIKESIITGEADRVLERMGRDPAATRAMTARRLAGGLEQGRTNMRRPVLSAGHFPEHRVPDQKASA